jgi:hypothetical protein
VTRDYDMLEGWSAFWTWSAGHLRRVGLQFIPTFWSPITVNNEVAIIQNIDLREAK